MHGLLRGQWGNGLEMVPSLVGRHLENTETSRIMGAMAFRSGILLSDGRGALPPLTFDNPNSSAIDFWIFLNLLWMFSEKTEPLSQAAYRKVHNCGPFN